MFKMTDVVKSLLILNVIVFVLTYFINPSLMQQFALYYPTSANFSPYQLVTHFFTHAGLTHILFNMFALVVFGNALEVLWGPKNFLIYYLVCAAGSAALHLGMAAVGIIDPVPAVGASGAIYGLLVAFAMKFPNTELMLIFLPIPIKAKYFVPGIILIDLVMGFGGFDSPIAHFAHLGGALFGFLLLLTWKDLKGSGYMQ